MPKQAAVPVPSRSLASHLRKFSRSSTSRTKRKSVDIDKVPFTFDSNEVIGFGGATYPFKIDFTNYGFEFKGTVDDTTYNMWVAPADTDTTDLEAKIIEYGFNIVDYDDAADA